MVVAIDFFPLYPRMIFFFILTVKLVVTGHHYFLRMTGHIKTNCMFLAFQSAELLESANYHHYW